MKSFIRIWGSVNLAKKNLVEKGYFIKNVSIYTVHFKACTFLLLTRVKKFRVFFIPVSYYNLNDKWAYFCYLF